MSITAADVDHIAKLANLSFSDEEKGRMIHDLNEIVEYVAKLNELDTTGVEPLTQVNEMENVLRPDVVRPSISSEEALRNAPSSLENFFTVPKVIGS